MTNKKPNFIIEFGNSKPTYEESRKSILKLAEILQRIELGEINQSKDIVKEEKVETTLQIQAEQKAFFKFFDDNFDTFVPKCKELFEENQDNDS
ncbi:MAG: hypothetical protein PHV37_07920 [Candidatus Gastranaerophilales bacterium]|nr:hypothetical protein [Candidatus Gastranaerophilales bacterium]